MSLGRSETQVQTDARIQQRREGEREIGDLHPPRGPHSKYMLREEHVRDEERRTEDVEEERGELMDGSNHGRKDSRIQWTSDTALRKPPVPLAQPVV